MNNIMLRYSIAASLTTVEIHNNSTVTSPSLLVGNITRMYNITVEESCFPQKN